MDEPVLPDEITSSQLARLVGLSQSRLGQLIDAGIIARSGRNRFPITAVRDVFAHTRSRTEGPKTFAEARTKLLKEKAEIARLQREELQGSLVPADQIEEAGLSWAGVIRDRALALPTRAAAKWGMCKTATDALAMLRREIDELLIEVSSMPVVFGGTRETEPVEADMKVNDEPPA
jgi:hypothetical protein